MMEQILESDVASPEWARLFGRATVQGERAAAPASPNAGLRNVFDNY